MGRAARWSSRERSRMPASLTVRVSVSTTRRSASRSARTSRIRRHPTNL